MKTKRTRKIFYAKCKARFHTKTKISCENSFSNRKLKDQKGESMTSKAKITINYVKFAKQILISNEINSTSLQQQKHDSHMNPKIFDAILDHERSISNGKQKRKTVMQKLSHLKHISCKNISCEM